MVLSAEAFGIDQASPLPLHYQLRELLRQQIDSGLFKPGDRFPTSRELRERYGVSTTTIERALAWLVEQGLVYRTPGRGTVVSGPPVAEELADMTGIPEVAQARGIPYHNRVLKAEFVIPTDRQAEILALPRGSRVFRLDRLIMLGGDQPISLESSILPPELGERLLEEPSLLQGVLYRLIEALMGWRLHRASQTIGAAVAKRRHADLLAVPAGSPLLRFDRIAYLTDGRPIQIVRAYLPAGRFTFHVWLTRREGEPGGLNFGNSRVSTIAVDPWEERPVP